MVDSFNSVNGDRRQISVERARGEIRHGRMVQVVHGDQSVLVAGIEALDEVGFDSFKSVAGGRVTIMLNWRRASALGVAASKGHAVTIDLHAPEDTLESAQQLAYGASPAIDGAPRAHDRVEGPLIDAVLHLCRLAQLVPAVMLFWSETEATATISESVSSGDILAVDAIEIIENGDTKRAVRMVSSANVPILEKVNTRFVAFRGPTPSDEQVAVIIGDVDLTAPVTIRVHSACLTGDVFGSLRCDCGEQLSTTLQQLAELGGGIVLYLAQEGRGIGLTNKLRAYELQDVGNDTYDANARLGFEPDERKFDIAGGMLRELGVKAVRLLTNNPRKVDSLRAEGIDVVDRVPLTGGLNRYNAEYLKTKVQKGGHFDEAAYQGRQDEQAEGGFRAKPGF